MNLFSVLLKALLSGNPLVNKLLGQLAKALKLTEAGLAKQLINRPDKLAKSLSASSGLNGINKILTGLQANLSKGSDIGAYLGKIGKEKRKLLGDSIADRLEGDDQFDTAILRSSWLVSGTFERTSSFTETGALTLTTEQGKSYTWYNVSQVVWENMKQARGSNGSGAGSVFWALHLRGYKRSPAQQTLALVFKLAGVSGLK